MKRADANRERKKRKKEQKKQNGGSGGAEEKIADVAALGEGETGGELKPVSQAAESMDVDTAATDA